MIPNVTNFNDTIPLTNLLRHILPAAPRTPQAMALDLIRQKYIDFARRSRLLCYGATNNIQAGVVDYYIDAPEDYEIYSSIGREVGNSWYSNTPNYVQDFDVIDSNAVQLRWVPSVDDANGLKLWVTLIPKECINSMPRSIATPFGKQIAMAACSDMLYLPSNKDSDPRIARKYELDYEKMLLSARALATSNRKIGSTSFQPVRIL